MLKRVVKNPRFLAAAAYTATAVLCLIILAWVLKLGTDEFRLSVPLANLVDGLFNSALIKGVIQNGWYLTNPQVGYPGGLTLYDFPMADNLHFFLIRIVAIFSHDWGVVLNLVYLATFPLAALSALFVFRRLRISYPVAVLGSLLFTFMPYHFFRGEGHLFLSGIYVIPLTSFAILRFFAGTPPFLKPVAGSLGDEGPFDAGAATFDFVSLRTAGYVLIALLTASAGVYYAVFALFLLVIAGACAGWSCRSWKPFNAAGLLFALIVIGLIANLSPTIIYQQMHGKNDIGRRPPLDTFVYGDTITQMLLPTTGHRLDFFREMKDDYFQQLNAQISWPPSAPTINENDYTSLGFIAGCGFLFSLGWLLATRRRRTLAGDERRRLLDAVGTLNIAALLLSTVGGFGLLISFLINPQIRAYNRISIYIAFFSILAVLLILEWLRQRYMDSGNRRLIFLAVPIVLLVVGVFDQTNNGMVPQFAKLNAVYDSDEAYFQEIEGRMPAGSHVFQLPYVTFPESEPNGQRDYEHFRAYLHTNGMYWSYGTVKGRAGGLWQKQVSLEPAAQMIKDLAAAGFNGIYINRTGYPDRAQALETHFSQELGIKPIINDDNTLLFFDMTEYLKRNGTGD